MRSGGGDFLELCRILAVHQRFRALSARAEGGPVMLGLGRVVQEVRFLRFGAEFAGCLSLVDFSFQQQGPRKYDFHFQWRCRQLRSEWQIFLHFLDAGGEIRFQGDHTFGHALPDALGFLYLRRTVEAPRETPPGMYRIRLGVWVAEQHAHLPLVRHRGWQRETPGWCHNAVLLGTLKV